VQLKVPVNFARETVKTVQVLLSTATTQINVGVNERGSATTGRQFQSHPMQQDRLNFHDASDTRAAAAEPAALRILQQRDKVK
jgi:hypothetical protein